MSPPPDDVPQPPESSLPTELKLAPMMEAPLTLSVAPAADTPDAKPPSLEITEEAKQKAALELEEATKKDSPTVLEAATPSLAPAVAINDEEKGTELEADPTNTPTQANDDPKDDKLGPTWFDALLLAIKSLTALGIDTSVEIYKNRKAILEYIKNSPENTAASVANLTRDLVNIKLIDPNIKEAFGNMLGQFKKIETELRDNPTDAQKAALEEASKQTTNDFLTKITPDEPKPAPTPSLSSVPKPTPNNTHTVPETEAEKKARETAEAAKIKHVVDLSTNAPTLTSVQTNLGNLAASGNQLPVSTPPSREITPQKKLDATQQPPLQSMAPVPETPAPAPLFSAMKAATTIPALTATTETPKPKPKPKPGGP